MFSDPPAWKQLIGPTLSATERAEMIRTIFSDRDETEVFEYLSGNNAQAFVNVVDGASIHTILLLWKSCASKATNSPIPVGRFWKAWTASRQESAGGVYVLHTGFVVATHYFRNR